MAKLSKANQRLAEEFAAAEADPLKPSVALLSKIGSIVVHAEEFLSNNGHPLDMEAMKSLVSDPEVRMWIKDMGVYLPVKR